MNISEKILTPGKALLAHLTYPQRFLLMGLVLVPLLVTIAMGIREVVSDVNFSRKERKGVAYVVPVFRLMNLVQLERAVAAARAAGDRNARSRIAELKRAIDHAVTDVEAVHVRYGEDLKTVH